MRIENIWTITQIRERLAFTIARIYTSIMCRGRPKVVCLVGKLWKVFVFIRLQKKKSGTSLYDGWRIYIYRHTAMVAHHFRLSSWRCTTETESNVANKSWFNSAPFLLIAHLAPRFSHILRASLRSSFCGLFFGVFFFSSSCEIASERIQDAAADQRCLLGVCMLFGKRFCAISKGCVSIEHGWTRGRQCTTAHQPHAFCTV